MPRQEVDDWDNPGHYLLFVPRRRTLVQLMEPCLHVEVELLVTNQHEASEFGPPWSLGGGSSRASTDMSLAHRGLWSKVSSHQSTTCKRQCSSSGEAQQV